MYVGDDDPCLRYIRSVAPNPMVVAHDSTSERSDHDDAPLLDRPIQVCLAKLTQPAGEPCQLDEYKVMLSHTVIIVSEAIAAKGEVTIPFVLVDMGEQSFGNASTSAVPSVPSVPGRPLLALWRSQAITLFGPTKNAVGSYKLDLATSPWRFLNEGPSRLGISPALAIEAVDPTSTLIDPTERPRVSPRYDQPIKAYGADIYVVGAVLEDAATGRIAPVRSEALFVGRWR